MRALLLFTLAICLYVESSAQNITDVIYLNNPVMLGTPRFSATGGAFTALGNDFSGVHVNPAGLAVFRHDELGVTMGFTGRTVNSTYYGINQIQDDNSFLFTNIGYVKKFLTKDPDYTWNLGITYNRNSDLNQTSEVYAENPTSSILQSWIKNANGIAPNDLLDNGLIYEYLAYQAYLMDPNQLDNYTTEAEIEKTGQFWSDEITSHFDELAFTFAADRSNKLYYGASLNIPFYKYDYNYYYTENGYGGDSIKGMEWFEEFSNRGAGFNIKLGAIYRPVPNLRLGASIFSPTWMGISQTYTTTVNAIFKNSLPYSAQYKQESAFKYNMHSAPQANLGAAWVFDKNGFLSLDYAFIPTKWSGTGTNELAYLNTDIETGLRNQHNIRFGAEARLQNFFVRGGYSWLSNPYNIVGQNATKNTFSLGVGYRTNKLTFDISYAVQTQKQLYYTYDASMVEPASQTISRKPFLASISFKL